MPFNLIALLLILIAAFVILIVSIRKFPDLANLDVEDLPEDQATKKKQKLLEQRFGRVFRLFFDKTKRFNGPVLRIWDKLQTSFRKQVGKSKAFLLKEEVVDLKKNKNKKEAPAEKADRVERLLIDADSYFEEGKFVDAERKYLEVVRLDDHNSMAYRGLGKVYMKLGSYDEATKTFEFLLQITPDDDTLYIKLGKTAILSDDYKKAKEHYRKALNMNDEVPIRHFEMAEIYKELGELDHAISHGERALEFEPTNPRYLDGLLEISIIDKNKTSSLELYKRLRMVNPENKKLSEFKHRMDEL